MTRITYSSCHIIFPNPGQSNSTLCFQQHPKTKLGVEELRVMCTLQTKSEDSTSPSLFVSEFNSPDLSYKRTKPSTCAQTSKQAHKTVVKSGGWIKLQMEQNTKLESRSDEKISVFTHCVRNFKFTWIRSLLSAFCGKFWVLVSPCQAHKIAISEMTLPSISPSI